MKPRCELLSHQPQALLSLFCRLAPVFVLVLGGCQQGSQEAPAQSRAAPEQASGATPEPTVPVGSSAPLRLSHISVAHGQLDQPSPPGAPLVASIAVAATVYKLPQEGSEKLGYLRLGSSVARDPEPVLGKGCSKGKWYRIYPMGYVCTLEVTTELDHPLVRASAVRADLSKPLPYKYGFVRATAPQYLRIPSGGEQSKSEFGLDEHLKWYAQHKAEVEAITLGANDVPLDGRGIAVPKLAPAPGFVASTALSQAELFGARSATEGVPFWLENGARSIPNVSAFQVPEYALFADRVRRHTGLSFVGSFDTQSQDISRRFAITVDLRLVPASKVKPDTGSAFHGVEIPEGMHFPFAFVTKRDSQLYMLLAERDAVTTAGAAPHRALVPLSGHARIKEGKRFYQTLGDHQRWLLASDIGIVHHPAAWPEPAEKGEKWIDISIGQQVLTLYDGKVARYATLVSSGRDQFGDPKKDLTTPLGDFRIQSKHVAAAMDSEENSSVAGGQKTRAPIMDAEGAATAERLKKAVAAGKKLDEQDARRWANVQKGRHPEYGVTRRRGSTAFELRDVPWIQYFSSGFALHGAYWHDVFGIPRSHGCVNLAPIDAKVVFSWTDPPVPDGWHGINVTEDMGQGTWVHIRR